MEIIIGNTALAIGLIYGLAALGTGIGFGLLGGKFLDCLLYTSPSPRD